MAQLTTSNDKHTILIRRWAAMAVDILLAGLLILVINKLIPVRIHKAEPWLGGTLGLSIALGYYLAMEAIWGATLGKFMARIRVVRADGVLPGWWRASLRTVLRLFEVNPFLLGGLPAYLAFRCSRHGQRLGDMLAKTFVVRSGDVPELRSGRMSVESLTPVS